VRREPRGSLLSRQTVLPRLYLMEPPRLGQEEDPRAALVACLVRAAFSLPAAAATARERAMLLQFSLLSSLSILAAARWFSLTA
jgi:hypothetical protein